KALEQGERFGGGHVRGAYFLSAFKGPATGEYRQAREQEPLPGSEQRIAPLQRRAQAAVPRRPVLMAPNQQRQWTVHSLHHRSRAEDVGPRRRKLQRQRRAVQPHAQFSDMPDVGRRYP